MKTKILSIFLLGSVIIFSSGCKKWLDINKDPNSTSDATVGLLLASAEVNAGSALGVDLQVNGSLWAQHWTQGSSSSQYRTYERYQPNAADYNRVWALLYSSSLQDLNVMQQKAASNNQKDYVAIAQILKAYLFQVITDGWGDVPFTEALRGDAQSGSVVSPKYDAQQIVYDGIDRMLDSARQNLQDLDAAGIATLGETSSDYNGDFIYSGDLHTWMKFANTLQLKVGLRLSEKDAGKAQTIVSKVFASAGDRTGFIEAGETAQVNYSSTDLNQNPLYAEIVGLNLTQNLVASATVVNEMNENTDYRVYAFFNYLPATGTVVGIPQGAYTLPSSTPVSIPSAYTGASAQEPASALAPVKFISDYESLFLQAEGVARGWGGVPGDDQTLYEDATRLSFSAVNAQLQEVLGIDANTAADSYFNGDTSDPDNPVAAAEWAQYPADADTKIKFIITQKWFSMTGTQGFEAWTEWRRTGYPDFFTVSVNSIIGSNFPYRFLYPDVEITRNEKFPGQQFVTQKVWWDAN